MSQTRVFCVAVRNQRVHPRRGKDMRINSLFVYPEDLFQVSSPEEKLLCRELLNARVVESYVCSTTYDKRQVTIVLYL
jgi:hypothetical protein